MRDPASIRDCRQAIPDTTSPFELLIRISFVRVLSQDFEEARSACDQAEDEAVTSPQEVPTIDFVFPVLMCFDEIHRQCLTKVERDGVCVHGSCWIGSPPVEERFTPGDILY